MLSSCSVSVWMRKGMARPELSQESSWLELPSRSLVDKRVGINAIRGYAMSLDLGALLRDTMAAR